MKSFKNANTETVRRILKLLTMSSMSQEEKALWFKLIPELDEKMLEKLVDVLSREVEGMTQIWLNVLQNRHKDS